MIALLLMAQPSLELELAARDAACPNAAAFRALVEETTPIGSGPPTLVARVSLEGPPWRAIVQTPAGQRSVEGDSCVAVAAAAAVIVALQLDAQPEPPRGPPPPPPPPAPPIAPKTRAVVRPDVSSSETASAARAIPWLRATAGLAVGPLPDPALAAELSAGLVVGWFRAELGVRYLFEQSISRGESGASFALLAGAARICADYGWTGAAIFGCAEGGAGAFFAEGLGVSDPERRSPAWVSFGAALGGTIALTGPLHLAPLLRAEFPLSRPQFTLDGAEVHRPRAWGIGAELGLEVHFR